MDLELSASLPFQNDVISRVLRERVENKNLSESTHESALNSVVITGWYFVDSSVESKFTDGIVRVILHLYDQLLILIDLRGVEGEYS